MTIVGPTCMQYGMSVHVVTKIRTFSLYSPKSLKLDNLKCFSQNVATISAFDRDKLLSSISNTSISTGSCQEAKDKGDHLHLLTDLYSKESVRTPYVTKILEETKPLKDKIILQKWRTKMIREKGKTGFQKYMDEILSTGTTFHAAVEQYFVTQDVDKVDISPVIKNYWSSVLPHLQHVGKVAMTEKRVHHPSLCYGGIVDCVALYKNVLCVIDWKTSRKPKRSLKDCYDEPYQVAAYTGAINAMNILPNKVTCGVLVKAYEDGSIADALQINVSSMQYLWFHFLKRLAEYHLKNFQLES